MSNITPKIPAAPQITADIASLVLDYGARLRTERDAALNIDRAEREVNTTAKPTPQLGSLRGVLVRASNAVKIARSALDEALLAEEG